MFAFAGFLAVFAAAGCGGGSNSDKTKTAATNAAEATTVAAGSSASATASTPRTTTASASTASASVGTAAALKPSILEAVSCRVPPVTARPAENAAPLQRQDIDTKLFPKAACNDETPAVLNFRPYSGEANRNKWVIALNGGGSCANGQDCADRWCGVGTNFDADNMSSANAGAGASDGGILQRRADNPFGDWNQVDARYCSSDLWSGGALAVTFTAKDPKSGKDVTYQINFAGTFVFEALIATLRQENVAPLVYTRAGGRISMPDLDDASEVVFAGGSGGGGGVIHNLDRLADLLKSGRNRPVVRGFIEAIAEPDNSTLGYAQSTACKTSNLCTYEASYRAISSRDANILKTVTDQSCLDWHTKNAPGTEWQCADLNHLLGHHVTTPFFVRMGLTDKLISSYYIQAGLAAGDGKPLTVLTFGLALRDQLTKLQAAVVSGHEKSLVTKAPGVFAPACGTHYTIFNNEITAGASVTEGGKAYTLFDVWNNWVAGKKPDAVISADPRTDKCPGE